MWNKQVEGVGNGVGKMKVCSLVLTALLILVLVPVASAEENELTFVIGAEDNHQSLINVRVTTPVNISVYTPDDVPDLSNKSVVFLASLNDSTLSNLTVNNSAIICGYNLTNTSLISTEDNNLSKYWVYGGDSNIADMTAYMDYHFLGNSSRSYDLPVPPADRINMTFVTGYSGVKNSLLLANDDALISKYARVNVVETHEDQMPDSLLTEDIIVLVMIGPDWLTPVKDKSTNAINQNNATVVVLQTTVLSGLSTINESSSEYTTIGKFWEYRGDENMRRLVTFLAATYKDAPLDIQDPVKRDVYGFYHPEAPEIFQTTEEYLEWYESIDRYNPDNITIGILGYQVPSDSLHSKVEDALIYECESRGSNAMYASFYSKDPNATTYFVLNDTAIVDAVISLRSYSLGNPTHPITTEDVIKFLKYLNVPVLHGTNCYYSVDGVYKAGTEEGWQNSSVGLSSGDIARNVVLPEFDGIFDPIILSWKTEDLDGNVYNADPVDDHVDWLVSCSINHAELRYIPNSEKKVAIIYYNHGGGKNNFHAIYLDVPESLGNLVNAMNASGYNIGNKTVPNETELIDLMISQGRNIGTWAPGELEKMVASGDVILWPQEEYMKWFNALPAENQEAVIDQWGLAPGEIMTYTNKSGSYFVFPCIKFGNVILGPQPTRGWSQNNDALYHNTELVPHHQYIAYYFWLQHEYEADAIMHFGTHSTQEWLPGKQVALSRYDWPAVMVADMPVVYPYIMDDVGEGIQAKRRGNALIVDHLTSAIIEAGLYGGFVNISDYITQYNDVSIGPAIKAVNKNLIIQEYAELDLVDALGVDAQYLSSTNETQFDDFLEDTLERYLESIKTESMPYGMHVIGEYPPEEQTVGMVRLMLGSGYTNTVGSISNSTNASILLLEEVLLNGTSVTYAQNQTLGATDANVTAYLNEGLVHYQNIQDSIREIPNILRAMNGEYIEPKSGNDPIRSPDSLPTGINFYSLDPRFVPGKAEWLTGMKLANQTLEMYMEDHNGSYPDKVAFVCFSTELIRHRGVTESEILYLLGIEPAWDSKGRIKLSEFRIISEEELGRPRIDILLTTSGLYRDMYPDKIMMIDYAVRLAANAQNSTYPNYVKQNSEEIYQQLIALNYTEEDAKRLSESRVVSRQPGVYGTGLEDALPASNTWDDESVVADLYIKNLGNFYGEGMWGESNVDLFKKMLNGVDVVVQSHSSNQLGLMDNDDFPVWNGGLALAVREVSGATPDMYISNLVNPDNMMVETLSEVLNREMYARYFNPSWIEGMMEAGFSGAQEMDHFVEYLWLWESTVPDIVSDANWDRIYETYFLDSHNLGLDEFFAESNPYARQSMAARMLETDRKGYWDASDEMIQSLVREYVESVVENGVTCCHHTCGNPLLDEYISGMLSVPGLSAEDAEKYRQLMDEATGREQPATETVVDDSSSSAWRRLHDSGTGNESTDAGAGAGMDAELKQDTGAGGEGVSNPADYVEGYEMQDESAQPSDAGPMSFSGTDLFGMLIVVLAAGAIYIGFRRRGG